MYRSLLLLLLLPLHGFAQYRPIYSPTPTRPSYTPAPVRPGPSPMQMQQQSQQMAHQTFQRMQAQQQTQMMQYTYTNQQWQRQQQMLQQQQHMLRLRSPQQLAQDQAQQQQAEQKATEQLATLAQEQQRKRLEHPAPDAQQAATQQQEDTRQLTLLTVKNYREVFLPGQITAALQSLTLAPEAQQELQSINHNLLDNAWWREQEATQLNGKFAAHSRTLALLTTNLLGFDLASPPLAPAPTPASGLDEMLAKNIFDPLAATQLIRAAAAAEKIAAGGRLAQAVQRFNDLTTRLAASPETPTDAKEKRNQVKASLRSVNKEMQRYNARVGTAGQLHEARRGILKSTADYLARNSK